MYVDVLGYESEDDFRLDFRNNSCFQNQPHPDDQTIIRTMIDVQQEFFLCLSWTFLCKKKLDVTRRFDYNKHVSGPVLFFS